MSEVQTDRKIVVVTADAVEETGTISFKFMIDAKLHDKIDFVPQMWAWVRKAEAHEGHAMLINVFKGGSGIVMGGPLHEDGQREEFLQDCWNSVPSCTILMTTESFKWFKEAAPKYGMEFEHVHHEGYLKTS